MSSIVVKPTPTLSPLSFIFFLSFSLYYSVAVSLYVSLSFTREHWTLEVSADKWVPVFLVFNWPLVLWKKYFVFIKMTYSSRYSFVAIPGTLSIPCFHSMYVLLFSISFFFLTFLLIISLYLCLSIYLTLFLSLSFCMSQYLSL